LVLCNKDLIIVPLRNSDLMKLNGTKRIRGSKKLTLVGVKGKMISTKVMEHNFR